VTGRYIQSDPIGFDGGVNGFGYVLGNSLRYIDKDAYYDEVYIDWNQVASTVETFATIGGAILVFIGSVFVGVLAP